MARPGETILAGVRLTMAVGWHTYWRNAGEAGLPTSITWTLPAGLQAGAIQWPAPEKLTVEDNTSYDYNGEVVLLVPLTISANAAQGEQEITAQLSWLECEVNCVPGRATVQAKLTIGSKSKPSPDSPALSTWQTKMPKAEPRLQARAWWEKAASGDSRPVVIEWLLLKPGAAGDFFPYEQEKWEVATRTGSLATVAGKIRLRKVVKKSEAEWPKELAGLIIEKSGDSVVGAYEAKLPLLAAAPSETAPPAPPTATKPLAAMLLLAFLGGLILNLMPCVLPVMALKILSFVSQSGGSAARRRLLGVVYGLGVLVSLLALGGAVIGVQKAGHTANWGMQFQNPQFVVVITTLVLLVALNLFGLFEVTFSGAVGAAGNLAAKEGWAGAFFNGILAVVLATPCTAPFLATALGFAFVQPPAFILLIFAAVAAGLALPYVLLSFAPGLLRFLPKPGAWMVKFKIVMGFPMLATAVWLFGIARSELGKDDALRFGLFLVVLALAAWIWGEFVQRAAVRRGLAMGVSLLLVTAFGLYALLAAPNQIRWQPWTPATVEKARAEGRPVLVDFTADWCLTCQVNKRTSLEVAAVQSRLKELQAVALLGDYTQTDPAITAELSRFGRAGVPLVLVYPKNGSKPPIVLPSVLTPSIVLEALKKAAE